MCPADMEGSNRYGVAARRRFTDKVRARETPFYDWLYRTAKRVRDYSMPKWRALGMVLYNERALRHAVWRWLKNQYYGHMMAYRCTSIGRNLALDGDMPLIDGNGEIHLGDNVRVRNSQTWIVGLRYPATARLVIGDNTTINYRTTISVAKSVVIGRRCLLAGEVKIFDNNSHATDYRTRRTNDHLTDADVAPVVIEDDV